MCVCLKILFSFQAIRSFSNQNEHEWLEVGFRIDIRTYRVRSRFRFFSPRPMQQYFRLGVLGGWGHSLDLEFKPIKRVQQPNVARSNARIGEHWPQIHVPGKTMYSSDFYPQPRNAEESTRLVVESLSKISPQLEGNDLHALFQTWFYRWLLIDTLFWVDCGYISFGKMPPFKPFHLQHLEKQNESRNFLNLKYCLLVLDWA